MYFALDFGGTNFRIGWSKSIKKINPNIIKIKNTGNYTRDSNRILKIMKSKAEEAKGIAIALPGTFNTKKKILDYANNLKPWVGKLFFKSLKLKFNCEVLIYKDSVAAAVGESYKNPIKENLFLYLTWGTGIGGCLVSTKNKRVTKITTLVWKTTFKRIEELCSGGHAITNFGHKMESLNDSEWKLVIDNFVKEIRIICKKLGARSILLGGGITAKRTNVVSLIQKELKQYNIKLYKSELGDLSAIYGGYILLRENLINYS